MNLKKLLARLEYDERNIRSSAITQLANIKEKEAINTLMNISLGKVLRTKKRGPWLLCFTTLRYDYELDDQIDCFKALKDIAIRGDTRVFNFLKTALTYGIENHTRFGGASPTTHYFLYRTPYEPFLPNILSFPAIYSDRDDCRGINDYQSGEWQIRLYPDQNRQLFEHAWREVLPIKRDLGLEGDDTFLIARYMEKHDT